MNDGHIEGTNVVLTNMERNSANIESEGMNKKKKKKLAPETLRSILKSADYYFYGTGIDVNKIRLRKPEDPARITRITNNKYSYLKQVVSFAESEDPSDASIQKLKRFGYHIKNGHFDKAILLSDDLLRNPNIPSLYTATIGYLSALQLNNEDDKFRFLNFFNSNEFFINELPHYYHLMDELLTGSKMADCPLFSLIVFKAFISDVKTNTELVPAFRVRKESYINNEYKEEKNHMDGIIYEDHQYQTPSLLPAYQESNYNMSGDVSEKSIDKLNSYITSQKWEDAFCLATKMINKDTEDHNALFNRAFCLIKMNRYQEAFRDIEKSLSIQKHPKYYKMRAALWYIFGQQSLAQKDINVANSYEEALE